MEDSQFEIKLTKVEESENDSGIWQYYTFIAYDANQPIASVAVDRLKEVKDPQYSDDVFFMDLDFDPPRPRPYLFCMGTDEDYRGRGIAGRMLEFANEYFKNEFGTPLYSGVINEGHAPRVWEKLVLEDKATECQYEGERRWYMH